MKHSCLAQPILAFLMLACLVSNACAQNSTEAAPNKLGDIRKVVEIAERLHRFRISNFSISSFEIEYIRALIAAERFDEVAEMITDNIFVAEEFFVPFCEAKLIAGEPKDLPEHIRKVMQVHGVKFERRRIEFSELAKFFIETAETLQSLKQQPLEKAIASIYMRSKGDGVTGHSLPHGFWIRATHATGGEPASSALIKAITDSIENERVRRNSRENMLLLTQSMAAYHQNERVFSRNKYRQRTRARWLEKLEECRAHTRMPLYQWLSKAVGILKFEELPEEEREQYIEEIIERLDNPNLEPYQQSNIRWRLYKYLASEDRWAEVIATLKASHLESDEIFLLSELCEKAFIKAPQHLDELIKLIPDAKGLHGYSEKLMTLLLQQGYLDKAERNVDSLMEHSAARYRKKIQFYRMLHDTKFGAISKYVEHYYSQISGAEDAVSFLQYDFDADHLADVAIHNCPAAALRLARALPKDDYFNNENALGICVTSLLRRREFDLAADIGKYATDREKEMARLGGFVFVETIDVNIEISKRLAKTVPNDRRVISQLIKVSIKEDNKTRAFEMAKRSMLIHRTVQGMSGFVEKGWHFELLDLAGEVERIKKGDDFFRDFQKRIARGLADEINFKSADEAIHYARKHLKRGKYGAEFLLKLARRWKNGL